MDLRIGRLAKVDLGALALFMDEQEDKAINDIVGDAKWFRKRKIKKATETIKPLIDRNGRAFKVFEEDYPEIRGTKDKKSIILLAFGTETYDVPAHIITGTLAKSE